MLLSLTLSNWRSHSSSNFEFSKGTNILVGKMGAGKSSVMDALCFALFGTFPKLARKETTLADTINFRNQKSACSVEITFAKGMGTYKISRSFSASSPPSASIYKDGKLFEKGPKAVTDATCRLLSIDYDSFVRAVYSEQNKIDSLLWLSPKERKAQIDELLGLDHFEAARTGAVFAANRFLDAASIASETLKKSDILSMQAKRAQLAKEQQECNSQIAAENASMEATKSALKENSLRLALLLPIKEKHASLSVQKMRLSLLCERMAQEIASSPKLPSAEEISQKLPVSQKRTEELAALRLPLQKLCDSLSGKIGTLSSQLKDAQERGKKIAAQKEKLQGRLGASSMQDLQQQLASLQQSHRALQAQKAALIASISELEKSVAALQNAHADCPVCGCAMGEEKAAHLRSEKGALLQSGTQNMKEASASFSSLEKEIAALEGKLKEAQQISASLVQLCEDLPNAQQLALELEAAKKELAAQTNAREQLNSSMQQAQQEHQSLLQLEIKSAQLQARKNELSQASVQLQKTEEGLLALSFREGDYETLSSLVQTHKARLEVAAAKISSLQAQARSASSLLSACEGELAGIAQLQKDAQYYSEKEKEMLAYKNCVLAVQEDVRNFLVEEINAALMHIWPLVYPYGDCTCVRLGADAKDYSIEMENNGWKSVHSLASGGERACLSLALRISFATVLTPHISWLILDEPTHNLDSQAVSMLASSLSERLPSIVEQIFVITHEQALVDSQQGTFYRLLRDNAKQEDTIVEKI
ncbi:SMC family ATPase [Candidatus Micrarchaeota archaeon]|nr:SMC family ATPase [Candidatus Micrarchaeota archaeon]